MSGAEESCMPSYQCFFMGADGKIVAMAAAVLPDEQTAGAWGAKLLQLRSRYAACEVWEQDLMISRHDNELPIAADETDADRAEHHAGSGPEARH
jgi:hypothetical protein